MTDRAQAIADAWTARLNAAGILPAGATAARAYTVEDDLPAHATAQVHVVARQDAAEPHTRETWLHKINVATAYRARVTADNASRDSAAAKAQQIADLAAAFRPLTILDTFPVTLEAVDRTLFLPKDLEHTGIFTALISHTWRVEVPTATDPTPSSSSSPSP